ncbi:hypothetical protein GJ744_006254 [Endocarpon pusillum]|uniref:Ankyrin repeat protein n=1 Tax=Endocarpon pusillum TaxID=364733 RepID=A0A8H7E612_9EURO|nr:hypothetical protein GJ744_006254 [Endocarpon pusillum]
MADNEGASPREQIVEACRRDNVELFQEVLGGMRGQPAEKIADFFNNTTDVMGNHLLHVCATYGSYDVMDELLNIEYLECDPFTRRDKETPIHSAVRYATERDIEIGTAMAKMLVDAGGDPRTKDKHGRTPAQMCDPKTSELRSWLTSQEYILREGLKQEAQETDGDDGPTGSASDSE